jgi:hypothetical protein
LHEPATVASSEKRCLFNDLRTTYTYDFTAEAQADLAPAERA